MKSITVIVVLLAVPVFAPGCIPTGAPPPPLHAVADERFNAVWDATTRVLRKYRFTIDRADRRAGIITTFPMIGRHWFEFWRHDATTRRDVVEGTLHTIYRRVTANIRRKDDSGEYIVVVKVLTSRSDRLSPQVTSISEVYDLFLDPDIPRSASLTGLSGPAGSDSVPLGRDENLEKILLQEINFLTAKKLTIYPK